MFLRVASGDALSNESIEVVKPVFCRREQFAFGNPFDDSIIYMSNLSFRCQYSNLHLVLRLNLVPLRYWVQDLSLVCTYRLWYPLL